MKTLVLGLGNTLLADEGVGVYAAEQLRHQNLGPDVKVLDVGTAVLEALADLEIADRVVIVDAVKAGGEPGTIYRIPFDECRQKPAIASMHGFDMTRVLAMTSRRDVPEVVVIGIEPDEIHWSLDLSSEIMEVMPEFLNAVEREIFDSGYRRTGWIGKEESCV